MFHRNYCILYTNTWKFICVWCIASIPYKCKTFWLKGEAVRGFIKACPSCIVWNIGISSTVLAASNPGEQQPLKTMGKVDNRNNLAILNGEFTFWLAGTKLHSHKYPSVKINLSPYIFIVKIQFLNNKNSYSVYRVMCMLTVVSDMLGWDQRMIWYVLQCTVSIQHVSSTMVNGQHYT